MCNNKRVVRHGRNGFVKGGKIVIERSSQNEWEQRNLAHGVAEESGT